jgi:YbbR domain-containing protein
MKLPALPGRRPTATDPEAVRRPTAPWERLLRLPRPADLRRLVQRDPAVKLFALGIAVFLWYSITQTETVDRTLEVPVSLRNLPEGITVATPPTKPVGVTLRGPRTILDNVDERRMRIQVGLKRLDIGDNRLDLNGNMLTPELPGSLKVVRFDPPSLTLRADRRVMRRVSVKADLKGALPLGYTVAESTVTPDMVEVTGPAKIVEGLKELRTEAIDLAGVHETLTRSVLLERSDEGTLTFVPDAVRVTVTLEETMGTREFPKVPVVAAGGKAELTPDTVDLTIRGPQRLLHNLKLEEGAVHVDVGSLGSGTHMAEVRVEVPDGLKVVARIPERVRVKVGGGGRS